MKREDAYYEAMRTRDRRFDGKFFVGVKTTGVYCRPICPARPKRENVEFFASPLEAERKGYRPCLRCRPESAPRSPVWIGKSALVQRALKLLHDAETFELREDHFAARFGVTARHLRRLFTEEVGKTPKQIWFESRLNLARQLITETRLPMTRIAFAAGFKSVRRFNAAFLDRFKRSPTAIRRSPLNRAGNLQVSLAYRPPFDFAGLLASYRAHAMGRLEWFDENTMHRVVEFNGRVGQVAITNDAPRARLLVDIDFPDTTKLPAILGRVRNLFDLDSDPVVIANVFDANSKLKALLRKHPGIRLPSGWDPFELAVATILGQLVSIARARALVADLIEMLGVDTGALINGQRVKLFPTAAAIAAADLTKLKTTSARRQTLRAFSRAVAEGQISLESTQDVDAFMAKVLAIPGIGPWTASYMALKVLRHTDAFPATDLVLGRVLKTHRPAVIEQTRPWRGYAAALFWREYSKL